MSARGGPARTFVVVACAGLAVAGCGGASSAAGGNAAPGGRSLTAAAVGRFRIDGVPIVAVGAAGRLWLGDDVDPRLYEVDPGTGRVVRRIDLDPRHNAALQGIAPLGRQMWVGFSIGPGDSTVPAARPVSLADGAPGPWSTIKTSEDTGLGAAFALNKDAAFIAGYRSITRIPIHGGRPRLRLLPDPDNTLRITAIAATPGVLWATALSAVRVAGHVVRAESALIGYDTATLQEISRRPLGDVTITSLLARSGRLWAATVAGPVLRIDLHGAIDSVNFPSTTQSLLADATGVWVIELKEGRVDHISNSGVVDETIRFTQPDHTHVWDDTPQALAALPGQLWVADLRWGYLWRITLPRQR